MQSMRDNLPRSPVLAYQSRRSSAIEAMVNVSIGAYLNFVFQLIAFPWFGIRIPMSKNLIIIVLFTSVSMFRSYAIRRWFNAYIIRLAQRMGTIGSQSPKSSFYEALVNVVIGAALNLVCQVVAFPLLDIHVPVATNLSIIAMFTGLSIVRGYIVRRWFNAYIVRFANRIERTLSGV